MSDGDWTLWYPKHALSPKDLISFVQMDGFAEDWDGLGLDVCDDLSVVEVAIMAHPKGSPIINGTVGLRKLEVIPRKRPDLLVHVYYVFFEELNITLLVLASLYVAELNEQQIADIRALIEEQQQLFSRGSFRFRNNL